VSHQLSLWQAVVLGSVVALGLGLSGFGLARIAAKQGLWAETVEVTVAFPEVHDVAPGCPVRVRGVDAGQVVAVEYPETDGPDAGVTVRMRLDAKFASRLHGDASAQIHSTGLLGQKVIAVSPGTPDAGPLADGRLKATSAPDLTQAANKVTAVAEKFGATADEAKGLIHDVRESRGSLGKLIRDDDLYRELKGLVVDGRAVVKKADAAVGQVEAEVGNVKGLVQDGRDTLRSVKQNSDAVAKLPVVRSYVTDANAILVRPDCRREAVTYATADLFQPGTAILTDGGRTHLTNLLGQVKPDKLDRSAEIVVAAYADPNDKSQTSASATELTKKQSEAVIEFFRANGVHKLGWYSRRKLTALGLGFDPPPVPEKTAVPPAYLQVVVLTPPPG
jgi:ABC-type transporter Mla subunit MlaD